MKLNVQYFLIQEKNYFFLELANLIDYLDK